MVDFDYPVAREILKGIIVGLLYIVSLMWLPLNRTFDTEVKADEISSSHVLGYGNF